MQPKQSLSLASQFLEDTDTAMMIIQLLTGMEGHIKPPSLHQFIFPEPTDFVSTYSALRSEKLLEMFTKTNSEISQSPKE